jgi:hypothetical protein
MMIIRGASTKLESPAKIGVWVEHVGGDHGFQLIAVCVDDSHLLQPAKVVHHLSVTNRKQSLVEGIDFSFIVEINILDVERFGFRVSHAPSIVIRCEVKVKGG